MNNPEMFQQKISLDIWRDKYRWKDEEHPHHSFARVCDGVYQKDTSQTERDKVNGFMREGWWNPAGRIHAGAGTPKIVTWINCLKGDTELYTKEHGNITLKEAASKGVVSVLTSAGWIEAPIRAYGVQPLNKITFKPGRVSHRSKIVHATAKHRWLTLSGETDDLRIGMKVLSCNTPIDAEAEEYRDGLVHGIIFGDGTLRRVTQKQISGGYPIGTHHYILRACGRTKEHYDLLDVYCKNYRQPPSANGDRIYYCSSMVNMKEAPVTESNDYIAGFIEGWWIADGYLNNGKIKSITSTNYEHLDWLIENAGRGGFVATGNRAIGKKATNLGVAKDPCKTVDIRPAAEVEWVVKDIKPAGTEIVYCAEVPVEHAFSLTEGLYTGNCFVSRTIEDSMVGIADALKEAMLTLQQGGGIGMDFSTLRPSGAFLHRTGEGSKASGPLPFMEMWDAMCRTIKSAGDRRGAMMAVMRIDHPDIEKFIVAKQTKGLLTNFNMSVLVTEDFWKAKEADESWDLVFSVPPANLSELSGRIQRNGKAAYIYKTVRARELWDLILRNTYEYSEPGVIFIDRINEMNNLSYCEWIAATNPCGEQPLPPWGACNLSSANLARLVSRPFSEDSSFEYDILRDVVRSGVRFLDNVIDCTNYPLEAQAIEQAEKRRIGLGISGLANALAMLRIRYGDNTSAMLFTSELTQLIAIEAFTASMELARERGPFPAWDLKMLDAPYMQKLPADLREKIHKYGLRNGTLLTIAPVGTTSLYYDNISSGLEPVFLFEQLRKVLQGDDTFKEYIVQDYGYKLFREIHGDIDLPDYMVTAKDLTVQDHLAIQVAAQEWIDTSISKTINVPEQTSFEEFAGVYDEAYMKGLKGCTTYRPSAIRGSILSAPEPETPETSEVKPSLRKRPEQLYGVTYKLRWPTLGTPIYVTINDAEGHPFEMFISSKSAKHSEWITGLTLMISAILRMGEEPIFVAQELQKVVSPNDSTWVGGKWYGSLVAYIGATLEKHIKQDSAKAGETNDDGEAPRTLELQGETCPSCNAPAIVRKEGCSTCSQCNFSTCD